MKLAIKILVFLGLTLTISCQKYLETTPDSSLNVEIDSEEKISELLAGAYPEASYYSFLESRTDNVEERPYGEHSRLVEAMYYWEDYDQEDLDTPLNYWNACYAGIAQANKALELLASYPKTAHVKALYGEAFLIRAYLHFMLVNIWAEPYGTQKAQNSPGIPYLIKPEKHALVSYPRGTVAETYDKIEQDLKLGITLVTDDYYDKPKFRFNKKAAYAFASRYYLIKGDWEKVVAYSDYVLGADPKKMLRKWQHYKKELKFDYTLLYKKYTAPEAECNLMLSTTESRIARKFSLQKHGMTRNLRERIYKQKIAECSNCSSIDFSNAYLFSASPSPITQGIFINKFDELALFGYTGENPRGLYVTNILFSADEVLLNRMEAYTMLRNYSKAIEDLKEYLSAKFDIQPTYSTEAYTSTSNDSYLIYTPFYGMTIKQLALVKTIVGLRQMEFIHEGLRWFDIRRFYLSVSRPSGYNLYIPLRKDDPRKVLQIPTEAINRGLEPNPR